MKAHNGIEGNELADKLAEEEADDDCELNVVYNRIPITTAATELKVEGLTKWQRQWEHTDKGTLCRSFFPTVKQRLRMYVCTWADHLIPGLIFFPGNYNT